MSRAVVIARKEIRDHLRDGRSLLSSALMALMGPVVVLFVSFSDRAAGQRGPGAEGGAVILGMLSVFALVSAFAGAIDIAMDATAGERERGSLVPLLLNPVAGSEVVVGKWIAVTVFALATLALNAASLLAVLGWATPSILAARGPQIALWIGLGLVPLACLGAALNLLAALTCRTTKEAHTALRILAFVPMLVGMFIVFFPSGLGRLWFLLPIVGQQMLIGAAPTAMPVTQSAILAGVTLAMTVPALYGATVVLQRQGARAA